VTARVAVVVGNPKPASRTLTAALHVARELAGTEPDLVVDLADLGPALLDWQDPTVAALVAAVGEADLVVVASPTYKATYTGLLKLFLDQFAGGTGLQDVVAVPLMLGAGPGHAMAPDLTLKPVLSELGGTCALPGLYLIDATWSEAPELDAYAERWKPVATALMALR